VADLDAKLAPGRGRRERDTPLGAARPLDERDRVGRQVVVQQARILPGERGQPEQIEVRDRNPPPVAAPDRERG
jgi:hypothetical protein